MKTCLPTNYIIKTLTCYRFKQGLITSLWMYILSQLKDICKMGSNLTRVLLDTLCIKHYKQQLTAVDGLHQAKPVRTPYPLPPSPSTPTPPQSVPGQQSFWYFLSTGHILDHACCKINAFNQKEREATLSSDPLPDCSLEIT